MASEMEVVAEAHERKSPSAAVVHETILEEGREELERPSAALAWSGLAAGLSMGFSLAAEGLLRAHLPDAEWSPLITKFGYTIGFLFVILGRQQLFTETTLTGVLPLLNDGGSRHFTNLMRIWGIVLVTNLIGAFIFAVLAGRTTIFSPEAREAFVHIGKEAIQHPFGDDVVKGIFGGWLVALIVWLLPAAESARFWTIIVVAYLIGVGELTHIIAGSVETLYLVATGHASFGEYIGGYMVPVLIGNTIGGIAFVAALNHAQATAGEKTPA